MQAIMPQHLTHIFASLATNFIYQLTFNIQPNLQLHFQPQLDR